MQYQRIGAVAGPAGESRHPVHADVAPDPVGGAACAELAFGESGQSTASRLVNGL